MKALRVIKKAVGLAIASMGFVLLCNEGCRYEPSWFWSGCWMLCLIIGGWMMEIQKFKPIREKLAEFDAEMAKAREEEE